MSYSSSYSWWYVPLYIGCLTFICSSLDLYLFADLPLAKKYKSITDFGVDLRTRGIKQIAKEIKGLGEKGLSKYSEWVI